MRVTWRSIGSYTGCIELVAWLYQFHYVANKVLLNVSCALVGHRASSPFYHFQFHDFLLTFQVQVAPLLVSAEPQRTKGLRMYCRRLICRSNLCSTASSSIPTERYCYVRYPEIEGASIVRSFSMSRSLGVGETSNFYY